VSRPAWLHTNQTLAELWIVDQLLFRGWWIATLLTLGMLVAIGCGGDDRFSAPAFEAMRVLGGRPLWCGLLAVLVLAMVAARMLGARVLRWCLYGLGTFYLILAVTVTVSALASPTSALTGTCAYTALAAFHLSHAVDYRRGHS
jgi:hypothetical protein